MPSGDCSDTFPFMPIGTSTCVGTHFLRFKFPGEAGRILEKFEVNEFSGSVVDFAISKIKSRRNSRFTKVVTLIASMKLKFICGYSTSKKSVDNFHCLSVICAIRSPARHSGTNGFVLIRHITFATILRILSVNLIDPNNFGIVGGGGSSGNFTSGSDGIFGRSGSGGICGSCGTHGSSPPTVGISGRNSFGSTGSTRGTG